ncbi:MAG: hypothetical protein OXJ53_21575 [Gammaproteobacteria bacterium]|nr:hypothetical protein [Gammaproteobacteria bacterium]MDE0273245.1 hypothetical protein [Gammaproteobacteria bacterium]
MRMAAGFAVVLMLSGCVPLPYKYYYMSLAEVDGLEVAEYGTTSRTAFLHKPMPVRYRLSRASYFVELEFDRIRLHPSFRVYAVSNSGVALSIETRVNRGNCAGWVVGSDGKLRVREWNRFAWDVIGRPHCLRPNDGGDDQFSIAFKVLDPEGEILGAERLPFTAERNGFIVDFDAL